MDNNRVIIIIIGMMLVTYIPRLVPFLAASRLNFSEKLRKFLLLIPYTALGALIFPGVFTATPEMPYAALLGICFTFIYCWFRGGIIVPVLGSIIVTYLVLML